MPSSKKYISHLIFFCKYKYKYIQVILDLYGAILKLNLDKLSLRHFLYFRPRKI